MSENKAEEIEQLAENYDRVLRETNNKMVQTDSPLVPVEIDWKPQNKVSFWGKKEKRKDKI